MANTLGAHLLAEISLNYTQSKISPSFGPEQSTCMKRKKNGRKVVVVMRPVFSWTVQDFCQIWKCSEFSVFIY